MKNNLRKLTALILALIICAFALASCSNDDEGSTEEKLTEEQIRTALADSEGALDGTLTIDAGTAEDVKAFSYVIATVNASDLSNKSYVRGAVNTLLTNPGKVTLGELKVCSAFNGAMQVVSIFYEGENFDSSAYTEEILGIICDGSSKTYDDWTVSATVNTDADSITIKAVRA